MLQTAFLRLLVATSIGHSHRNMMTSRGSYTLLVRLACLHSRKTEDASATHLECCDKRARSKSFSLSGMLYSPYRVNGKKRSSCQSRKGSQFSREEGILVRAAHSHPLRR